MISDQVIVIHDNPPHNDWGAWARTDGICQARESHLLFMDDDDEYVEGAFAVIREAVQKASDRVHIFRIARTAPFEDTIWQNRDLTKPGDVSTQMFVIPNDDRVGVWSPRYEGDFDFLVSTLACHDEPPVWHEDVIATVYPGCYQEPQWTVNTTQ